MYCNVKCSFPVKVLVVLSVLQCSKVQCGNNSDGANNQRNMLIDGFQNALVNDSEQLFTLKRHFFFHVRNTLRLLDCI